MLESTELNVMLSEDAPEEVINQVIAEKESKAVQARQSAERGERESQ